MKRRDFIKGTAGFAGGLLLYSRFGLMGLARAQQVQLPGSSIPQFVDPLPLLDIAGGTMQTVVAGATPITMGMHEFQAHILPTGTFAPGVAPPTWVWGYRTGMTAPTGLMDTYIGPVVVATRGAPTEIEWVNMLPQGIPHDPTNVTSWFDATDQTLHWADPMHNEANACYHGTAVYDCNLHYTGPIPAVPHLHGGEVPPVIDGGPDSWCTSDSLMHGHSYYTRMPGSDPGNMARYRYPNSQEGGPLWFHDHVMGLTRLNVYAGLAGAYLLTDPSNPPPANLPGPADIIPLVIQDRAFDVNGELFFNNVGINPQHPYWVPELVGDTNVVNGKAWPYLNVEPRRYRFLVINGSNARAYALSLSGPGVNAKGPTIWQIATDGGFLDVPVQFGSANLRELVLQPGERAEIIIDFATVAGRNLQLRNSARHPYPGGSPPNGNTVGRVMEFRVSALPVVDTSYDPASGQALRQPMVRLANPVAGTLAAGVAPVKRRQLTLNEVIGAGGPLELLINNTGFDGMSVQGNVRTVRGDFTPVTTNGISEYLSELPDEGSTEVWEIVNLTADAHPIHLHLVQFQLLNRQRFNANNYNNAYNTAFGGAYVPHVGPPFVYDNSNNPDFATQSNPPTLGGNPDVTPFLQGAPRPPEPNEAGWKDTIKAFPGEVTRIVVRFAPTDIAVGAAASALHFPFDPDAPLDAAGDKHGYVWHCHIIDHEDNEMMRPYRVMPKAVARSYVKGTDY